MLVRRAVPADAAAIAAVEVTSRDNVRARRLYEKQGWTSDGERSTDDYGGRTLEALRYEVAVRPVDALVCRPATIG